MTTKNANYLTAVATRVLDKAIVRETALVLLNNRPVAVSTNSRDYLRAAPKNIIGVYNGSAEFKWILEDLRSVFYGK